MKKSILEISKKKKLAHIGSCLSVLPILEEIYKNKKPQDKVILSGAHSHLAHLHFLYKDTKKIEEMLDKYGIHCDIRAGCDASGGSLGHGIGIGIGMALANPKIKVHVICTDGSLQEGSEWEAIRINRELKLKNLEIHVNMNGYTALAEIDQVTFLDRLWTFDFMIDVWRTNNGKGFSGVQGHYKVL